MSERGINLTRFPLFFPEKWAFFLENAGVFNFSNTGSGLLPFFSRRIGLLSGQEVPILVGSKLTGKVDRFGVGVLGVRTQETDFVGAKTFFVGRAKANLFKQSYVGGIYAEGNSEEGESSRTFGTDLRLFTSRFLGKEQNFGVDAFTLKSHNEGARGKDVAYGFVARHPNDLFDVGVNWRHIPQNFNPALGFVQLRHQADVRPPEGRQLRGSGLHFCAPTTRCRVI